MSLSYTERVADLVGRLTLTEKFDQMARGGAKGNGPTPAIDRLEIAAHIWGTECATGLGSDDAGFGGTSFPQPLGQAATWDSALIHAVANVTSTEIRAQHNEDVRTGVVAYHHGLNCWSPVINIMRHWAWGRNDETYGECPVLSGDFARAFVTGLQGPDPRYVAATAGCKHFVVHGGPDNIRQTFSANVTLRDWSTTFMPQFESCVESGGLGMMCSFNAIRGVPACANHRAMVTWARKQWNFPGYMVSDQGAAWGIYSKAGHAFAKTIPEAAAYAVRGGLDLEDTDTPADSVLHQGLPGAVAQGLLSESDIDRSVSRLMYVRMKTGEFDPAASNPYRQITAEHIRSPAHLALTREVATKSFVLLENRDGVLPLDPAKKLRVAVVGPFADCQACYYGKYSPHVDVNRTVTVAGGLRQAGHSVVVAPGCTQEAAGLHPTADGGATGDTGQSIYRSGEAAAHAARAGPGPDGCGCASCPCPSGAGAEPYMCRGYNKSTMVDAVAEADVCIVAVGLGANVESEGRDREAQGLALPGQQNNLTRDAIDAAKAKGIPVVVLLFVAGAVDPLLFAEADAIVDCFYPAESTGLALADILFGAQSPAGRLPFSWPTTATDVLPEADYTMVGRTYRYAQKNVRWAFGHGLSYSTFRYGSAALSTTTVSAVACRSITVTVDVKNTGVVDSDEVAQLYLRWSSLSPPEETPSLSLADFARAPIAASADHTYALTLSPRDYAVLTAPRCGVVPDTLDTQLSGTPFHTTQVAATAGSPAEVGVAACCSACGAIEKCEAFTLQPGGTCQLFTAWTQFTASKGAISGEPLSQWVIRPGTIELLVGGSSTTAKLAGTVTVTGAETPLAHCPTSLRN